MKSDDEKIPTPMACRQDDYVYGGMKESMYKSLMIFKESGENYPENISSTKESRRSWRRKCENFEVNNGLLKYNGRYVLVEGKSAKVLQELHLKSCHGHQRKVIPLISLSFTYGGLNGDLNTDYIQIQKACEVCSKGCKSLLSLRDGRWKNVTLDVSLDEANEFQVSFKGLPSNTNNSPLASPIKTALDGGRAKTSRKRSHSVKSDRNGACDYEPPLKHVVIDSNSEDDECDNHANVSSTSASRRYEERGSQKEKSMISGIYVGVKVSSNVHEAGFAEVTADDIEEANQRREDSGKKPSVPKRNHNSESRRKSSDSTHSYPNEIISIRKNSTTEVELVEETNADVEEEKEEADRDDIEMGIRIAKPDKPSSTEEETRDTSHVYNLVREETSNDESDKLITGVLPEQIERHLVSSKDMSCPPKVNVEGYREILREKMRWQDNRSNRSDLSSNFVFESGCLKWRQIERNPTLVCVEHIEDFVKLAHTMLAHVNYKYMFSILTRSVYCNGLLKALRKAEEKCELCQHKQRFNIEEVEFEDDEALRFFVNIENPCPIVIDWGTVYKKKVKKFNKNFEKIISAAKK